MKNEQFLQLTEKAITGILEQGEPAVHVVRRADCRGEVLRCAYQTPDGLKCAVGQIIPEEKYVKEMDESKTLAQVLTIAFGPRAFTGDQMSCLSQIQQAHDHNRKLGKEDFLREFEQAAREAVDEYVNRDR